MAINVDACVCCAGVQCCCVAVPQAAIYEDASPASQPVAFLEDREDTIHPYAILAVEGTRAQVQNHDYGFIWIDKHQLEPVCTRLQHEGCVSTLVKSA